MSDKVLHEIAAEKPLDEEDLLMVPGVGAKMAKRYGARILKLVAQVL